MQALTRDTQVPVSIALITRDEISLFLDGQIEALREEKYSVSKTIAENDEWEWLCTVVRDKILT